MSVHIEAKQGEIADKILLPGDPLRAKHSAETFLENPVCYNQVRGMLGYTGTYKGERVSVQGTGMGMPSAGIYAHELINSYDVKKLIRVGTCGSISEKVNVRELVIAQAAATPSSATRVRRRPSNSNGFVTTATTRAPAFLASRAAIGAEPVPVPPPRPAVKNTMSAPLKSSAKRFELCSAAKRPSS